MNTISFSIDRLELMEATKKSQFARAKVDCFASGNNAHNMPVSKENLKKYADTILGKPLTYVIEKPRFGKKDFGDHDPFQVPMGYFSEVDAEITFRELDDGRLMMSAYANIWKKYAIDALKIFERDGMKKAVSVEMQIIETKDDELGRKEITDFAFSGCTILGSEVNPAIKDASVEILAFSQAKEQNEKILARYKSIDFSIPDSIISKVSSSLAKAKEENINILPATFAKMNYIIKNKKISPEKVDGYLTFFNKHKDDLSFSLCGGEESKNWFFSLFKKMEDADSVCFSNTETKEDEKMEDEKGFEAEVKEEEKEDFALDANAEPAAQVARSEEETEGDKEAIEEEKEEFAESEDEKEAKEEEKEEEDKEAQMACHSEEMSELKEKFSKLEAEFSVLSEEAKELRAFKENILKQEKLTKVNFTISEVSGIIPKERLTELAEFSIGAPDIDVWVNAVKAEAYTYMQKQIQNQDGVLRMAMPDQNNKKPEAKKSLWAD